ncbi:MAG: hypothetical protein M3355_10555 [Actinomycetota bacterium]|nr:hypothetical protein [Actinomycetota bacterium]
MRTPVASLAVFCAVMGVALPIAGCGEEHSDDETPEVVEGEPLELGELVYNVAITRFLNPNIVEDSAYLEGAPEEPNGMSYMGVFILIKNEGDKEVPSAGSYEVVDGSHRVYRPVEGVETPFSLDVGANVPVEGEIPASDTVAASGPTQGALLLFLVDDDVSEERPLELEVSTVLGEGMIELDI